MESYNSVNLLNCGIIFMSMLTWEVVKCRQGRIHYSHVMLAGFLFLFFFTKQASPSLLVFLVTFWKIALCYNGLFHITLKRHMHAIYRLSYII